VNDLTLYNSVRDQMLNDTGGCIEWHSNKPLGAAIQSFSHSYLNHASLLIPMRGRKEPRIFITEALADGVVPNFLSVSLAQYDGEAYWYPLKDEWEPKRNDIEDRAFSYLGVPYDYENLFKNAVEHTDIRTEKLFCSEYVWVCYGFTTGPAPRPGELAQKGIFKDPVRIL